MSGFAKFLLFATFAATCQAFAPTILMTGLLDFNDTQTYDPSSGLLGATTQSRLSYGLPRRIGAAAGSWGAGTGKAIFVGGKDHRGGVYQDVWEFDATYLRSTRMPQMLQSRFSHGMTIKDGIVTVCGGATNNVHLSQCEQYDGHQWYRIASLPIALSELILTNTPGGVLAIGGVTENGTVSQQVYEYNSHRGQWEPRSVLPVGLRAFGAVQYPGTTYTLVCGGYAADATSPNSNCYTYDPSGNGYWTGVSPMQRPRAYFSLVAHKNGYVYALGGEQGNNIASSSVDMFYCASCGSRSLQTTLASSIQQSASVAIV